MYIFCMMVQLNNYRYERVMHKFTHSHIALKMKRNKQTNKKRNIPNSIVVLTFRKTCHSVFIILNAMRANVCCINIKWRGGKKATSDLCVNSAVPIFLSSCWCLIVLNKIFNVSIKENAWQINGNAVRESQTHRSHLTFSNLIRVIMNATKLLTVWPDRIAMHSNCTATTQRHFISNLS